MGVLIVIIVLLAVVDASVNGLSLGREIFAVDEPKIILVDGRAVFALAFLTAAGAAALLVLPWVFWMALMPGSEGRGGGRVSGGRHANEASAEADCAFEPEWQLWSRRGRRCVSSGAIVIQEGRASRSGVARRSSPSRGFGSRRISAGSRRCSRHNAGWDGGR